MTRDHSANRRNDDAADRELLRALSAERRLEGAVVPDTGKGARRNTHSWFRDDSQEDGGLWPED